MNITFNDETDGKITAGSLPVGAVFTPDMKTFYLVINEYNLDKLHRSEINCSFPALNLNSNTVTNYLWDCPVYVCDSELKLSLKNN